jgi:hypothetical protein
MVGPLLLPNLGNLRIPSVTRRLFGVNVGFTRKPSPPSVNHPQPLPALAPTVHSATLRGPVDQGRGAFKPEILGCLNLSSLILPRQYCSTGVLLGRWQQNLTARLNGSLSVCISKNALFGLNRGERVRVRCGFPGFHSPYLPKIICQSFKFCRCLVR